MPGDHYEIIVVRIAPPTALYLCKTEAFRQSVESEFGFDWTGAGMIPTLADFLVDEDSGKLVGLSFWIPEEFVEPMSSLCLRADARVCHLVRSNSEARPVTDSESPSMQVDIRLTRTEGRVETVKMVQDLSLWYLTKDGPSLTAIQMDNLCEFLDGYKLSLPGLDEMRELYSTVSVES